MIMPTTFNKEAPLSKGSYPSTAERAVQEQLGNTLREIYRVMAERPTYVAEPSFPAAIKAQLDRLASRIPAGERGASAVAEAPLPDAGGAKE
jgi:hypothetical protein